MARLAGWDGSVDVVDKSGCKPEKTILNVYPNPFNSSCVISTPAGSEIEIYDLRGTLRLHSLPDDNHSLSGAETNSISTFIWQPDQSMASQVYYVRVTTPEGRIATKRIVYLK